MSRAEYERWCSLAGDDEIKEELAKMASSPKKIEEAFFRSLEFGTGGLRGIIGAGSNRMNIYTVKRATLGLAKYMLEKKLSPAVAIGYDTRNKSREFAECAATVFESLGIKSYIFAKPYPTPLLSYATRELHCGAGIMITASHNPKEYNGYKVYGADGAQITDVAAGAILAEINECDYFDTLGEKPFSKCLDCGMVEYVSEELITSFVSTVSACSKLYGDSVDKSVKIVYTPLNGTGYLPVSRILAENGYKNVTVVAEQSEPDGNFPTCPYPNPEIAEALSLGLEYAKRCNAEILLATDPDCDRVGVAVKDGDSYKILTGNEVGILLLDYIASQRVKHGYMPKSPIAVKTVVTTDLATAIAKKYGIEICDVLTGFKYIGETVGKLEADGCSERFIFGFEESCGYLSAPYVRDKDGVFGAYLVAEMTAFHKAKGKTLFDVLAEIYDEFGYEKNSLYSYAFGGVSGADKMRGIMAEFRSTGADFCGIPIKYTEDYSLGIKDLPKSNVLKFFLDGDSTVTLRPSGTEPKLKMYISVRAKSADLAECATEKIKKAAESVII